jgi:hypothetical protein
VWLRQVPSFGLTRLGGVFGKPMSEYVFAFVLSRERKLPQLRELQARKEWYDAHAGYDYRPLSSLTLGAYSLSIHSLLAHCLTDSPYGRACVWQASWAWATSEASWRG